MINPNQKLEVVTLRSKTEIRHPRWEGRSVASKKDMLNLYTTILDKKGVYFHLTKSCLDVIYRRYKELGGAKEYSFA
jgi:hypothetical protein